MNTAPLTFFSFFFFFFFLTWLDPQLFCRMNTCWLGGGAGEREKMLTFPIKTRLIKQTACTGRRKQGYYAKQMVKQTSSVWQHAHVTKPWKCLSQLRQTIKRKLSKHSRKNLGVHFSNILGSKISPFKSVLGLYPMSYREPDWECPIINIMWSGCEWPHTKRENTHVKDPAVHVRVK